MNQELAESTAHLFSRLFSLGLTIAGGYYLLIVESASTWPIDTMTVFGALWLLFSVLSFILRE